MENLRLHKAASTSVNVTVGRRSREYLIEREVERLMEAAKQNRSGHRDATAILVGLASIECAALDVAGAPRRLTFCIDCSVFDGWWHQLSMRFRLHLLSLQ